jgi:hypothetical protein
VLDKSNAEASTSISKGLPKGSLIIVDPSYGRGFTFGNRGERLIVIITGKIQVQQLGAG